MTNIKLTLISIIATLIVFESFLQFYFKKEAHPKEYSCIDNRHPAYSSPGQCPSSQARISDMEFNPDILYAPKPSTSSKGMQITQEGYRATPGSANLADRGAYKIVITGGSTAFGVGVRDDQTIAAFILQELKALCGTKEVAVVNLAVPAQTSGQEGRRLEAIIDNSPFDVHIAISGFNDIYNGWSGLLPHQNRDYFDIRKEFSSASKRREIPAKPSVGNYHVRLKYLLDMALYKATFSHADYVDWVGKSTLNFETIYSSMLRNIRTFSLWSQMHNHEFIYAFQPSIYNTAKVLTNDERIIAAEDEVFGQWHSKGYQYFRDNFPDTARELNINYVDLDPALISSRDQVFIDNVHFGDKGYKILAHHIVSYLTKASSGFESKCRAQ